MISQMSGRIVGIYITDSAGEPMRPVERVHVLPDQGLEGDRYAAGIGAWSKSKQPVVRHLSLIAIEAIQAANAEYGTDFQAADTRRNIVTEAIDLNRLIDVAFNIGPLAVRGVELCEPCERPSKLSGKPGFSTAFANRGGLRAEVLSTEPVEIAVGDEILSYQEQPLVVLQEERP